nr:MAG TPA: hypothetical protein [Caudoviricetes sp.]
MRTHCKIGIAGHLKMNPHFSPGQPFQWSAVVFSCPSKCSGIILDQWMNTLMATRFSSLPIYYSKRNNNIISIKTNVT